MPFLPPNQQRQSTKATKTTATPLKNSTEQCETLAKTLSLASLTIISRKTWFSIAP